MSFGVKTNEGARPGVHEPGERPGSRAQVKYVRMSAYKARVVLDLIRGMDVEEAESTLRFTEREAARVVRKCLLSAMANAQNNDGIDPETLYVSACFADEGMTIKRWRPRARGRATRIRKRTCHITVIVSPRSPEELEARRRRDEARGAIGGRRARTAAEARAARVARSRAAAAATADETTPESAATPEEPIVEEVPAGAETVDVTPDDDDEILADDADADAAPSTEEEEAGEASASEPPAPAEPGAERRPEPEEEQD
jgi:large subunit ribosomal protein L22